MGEVTIICGMTETSPLSTQTEVDEPIEKRVTTVGRVHPHVQIKVIDPTTGDVVPRGGHSTSDTRMPSPGRHGSDWTRSSRSLARTFPVHVSSWPAVVGRSMALLSLPPLRVAEDGTKEADERSYGKGKVEDERDGARAG